MAPTVTRMTLELATLGGVDAGYRHYPKQVTPGPGLALPDAYLKWYEVHPADAPVPAAMRAQAQEFLRAEAAGRRLEIDGELGFVVLHRCGESYYFLLVCTWRRNNELWETPYGRDAATAEPFAVIPQGRHLEVVCVWELGAVLHEQQAWIRYLYSARDEAATRAYLEDQYSGSV